MKPILGCPKGSPDDELYKKATIRHSPFTMMPSTSPQIASKLFDALLFTPFHENVTIYPVDVFVASPRGENFRPPMSAASPTATYISILSAGCPLTDTPISTMTQGSFPLPDHAVAAIAAILSYYLPHNIDAQLHHSQWFLIGQGRHSHHTIFIPSSQRQNVQPAEPHPSELITVYMNDEDRPLPTPP